MKKQLLFTLLLFWGINTQATTPLSFQFGTKAKHSKATRVDQTTIYNNNSGYGFDFQNTENVEIKAHYCTSSKPFYFSVKVPEGVYEVEIVIGAEDLHTNTTLKAESRRLMFHDLVLAPSETVTKTVMIDIRNPKINDKEAMLLKSREINDLNWDNRLTLEFSGDHPAIRSIKIKPAKKYTTLFLAGNSTVTDQDCSPWASWGQMIPAYLDNSVVVANYAVSGSALASFKGAKRLDKILSIMQPGDYLFIEFGHNDQKRKGEGIGPWLSFTDLLNEFITRTQEKGGIPVLITPTQRRTFNNEGKIMLTHGDYPDAMRKVAQERNIPLIDIHKKTKIMYETWGKETSKKAFVQYPAHTFPGQDKALKDNTHFNEFGANEVAQCVLQGIIDLNLPIRKAIKKGFSYDPQHPHTFSDWTVPMSPRFISTKPEGN